MRIKYPNSDNALRELWYIISFIRRRFSDCIRRHHDPIAVLYISSLIITPGVAYEGRRLLNEIRNLVSSSPTNFICVIRTTAPSYFKRSRRRGRKRYVMERLQEESIELLRDVCYTVVYDPNREFLNHAKFLVFYLMCLNEGMIYHGKYYGSTNLTMAGLAVNRRYGTGNYEEFTVIRPRPKILNLCDAFYLEEVLRLIDHRASLYTNPSYLRHYLTKYLSWLKTVLEHSHRVVSGTTLGELYEAYVNLLVAYDQTYALLDELPGKLLTRELVDMLMEVSPPIDPFELEMMMPANVEDAELLAKDLEFSSAELRDLVINYITIVKESHRLIEEKYLLKLEEMERYLDDKERYFVGFLRESSEYHRSILRKLVSEALGSERA